MKKFVPARLGQETPTRNVGMHAEPVGVPRRHVLMGAASSMLALGRSHAQVAKPFNDVLVVVPGIMGSTLYRGNKLVWGLKPQAFISLLQSGSLDLAHLRDAPGSGPMRAGELFESATVLPGFWKLDGYTELRQGLVTELSLTPQQNYFEFAYDWRQDNRKSARELLNQCRLWLANWRSTSGHGDARVVLVCHSMGGLVARYACEVLGGHSLVRAVFSLGTPYQGSFKALNRLVNGLVSRGLTQTLASFDSVYQLLPTYECIEAGDGKMRPLSRYLADLDGRLDGKRVRDMGLAFHDECDVAAKKRKQAGIPGAALYVVESSTHRTPAVGRWQAGRLEVQDTWRGKPTLGDGTVPGFALAQPTFSASATSVNHSNQLHGAIQNHEAVLVHVVGTIQTGLPSGTRSTSKVSMECMDVAQVGQDLALRLVLPLTPSRDAKVTLVDTGDGTTVGMVELKPVLGQLDFKPSLSATKAGLYRLVFSDRGAAVCNDLVTVV